MFNGKKVIILVWSPIGYEVYLTLCLMLGSENVILISARNFNPPEAQCSLGVNHHYFTQTNEQIEEVCHGLKNAVAHATQSEDQFVLFVPQMGNFYGRSLIESDLCEKFFIYDEGSAAYGEHFITKSKELWMRHFLVPTQDLQNFYSASGISVEKISAAYKAGVKFYDLMHPKLSGLVGFFPDAFPGYDKIELPLSPFETINLNNVILAVLPPLKFLVKDNKFLFYTNQINDILKSGDFVVALKSHPSDDLIPFEKYKALLNIPNAVSYNDFSEDHGLSPFRETALMGFGHYLTDGNSTQLYIDQLKKVSAAEYPVEENTAA